MGIFRKVIRIRAEDSPNVRLGLEEVRRGLTPSDKEIVPGVLRYSEYAKRRALWPVSRQAVGLDAEFYEGAEVKMFPEEWLVRAMRVDIKVRNEKPTRKARGIGIDPAEGGDKTAMAAVDEFGLIELVSKKTPDTTVVVEDAIAFMLRHGVNPEAVCFDRGGGGKQHADHLRKRGYKVETVGFGEAPRIDLKRGMTLYPEKKEVLETRYGYLNRRGEMYDMLRMLLDPVNQGWGVPAKYDELFYQLRPLPLRFDGEGRFYVIPKNRKDPTSETECLTDLIGHSPDETDAVLLAVFAMTHKPYRHKAGSV